MIGNAAAARLTGQNVRGLTTLKLEKNALIGFTTNAYSFKRLALLRLHLPIPPPLT